MRQATLVAPLLIATVTSVEAQAVQRRPSAVTTRAGLQAAGYRPIHRFDSGYNFLAMTYYRRGCEVPIYSCSDRNSADYGTCMPIGMPNMAATCSPNKPDGTPKLPGWARLDAGLCAALQPCAQAAAGRRR
jgi:hypothetical protein